MGRCFGLYPLLLAGVLDANQRPKLERYEGHTYLVLRVLKYEAEKGLLSSEQLSLISARPL